VEILGRPVDLAAEDQRRTAGQREPASLGQPQEEPGDLLLEWG